MLKSAAIKLLLCFLAISLPSPARAQMVLGQYEDEAPLGTWNQGVANSAASLSLGGSGLFAVGDSLIALSNPSQLVFLPRLTISMNASLTSASLRRFSVLNTGPISSPGNLYRQVISPAGGGAAYQKGGWAVAVHFTRMESYARPPLDISERDTSNRIQYSLRFRQAGYLDAINLAAAHKIGARFSLGLGVNITWGAFDKTFEESLPLQGYTITDIKSHQYQGLYLNGGISWIPCSTLDLAFGFRTAHTREADSQSLLRYAAPAADTNIEIGSSDPSRFTQPSVIRVGARIRPTHDLRFTADLNFYRWSQYDIEVFQTRMERDFRDILMAGLGFETHFRANFFRSIAVFPTRIGIQWDPQPMRDPHSRYINITAGVGISWKWLQFDLGGRLGFERGSGDRLANQQVILTLSFKSE